MPLDVRTFSRSLTASAVAGLMKHSLRTAFRRVCWVGRRPSLPHDRPVVLYANHHNFYDGYLLWLVTARWLERRGLVWMEDADRFPFFKAQGALPFPPDDARRRAAAIRRTIRRFERDARTVLVYFPEGHLHPPEDGLLPFAPEAMQRLDRLLPNTVWWPVAVHATWWGEPRPTALLTGGMPHEQVDGGERAHLEALWQNLRCRVPQTYHTLLTGRSSVTGWDFSGLKRFLRIDP